MASKSKAKTARKSAGRKPARPAVRKAAKKVARPKAKKAAPPPAAAPQSVTPHLGVRHRVLQEGLPRGGGLSHADAWRYAPAACHAQHPWIGSHAVRRLSRVWRATRGRPHR